MVRRRRRKWGEGQEGVEAHEDPRIAVGKQQGKLEWLLFTATKKKKKKSRSTSNGSNKISLLNRIQSAHTKKTASYAGGKGGFSEVIPEKGRVFWALSSPDLSPAGWGNQWTNLFLRPCLPAGRESNPRAKVTGNTIPLLAVAVHSQNELLCDKSRVCVHSKLMEESCQHARSVGTQQHMHLNLHDWCGPAEPCTLNSYKSSRILNALGELVI